MPTSPLASQPPAPISLPPSTLLQVVLSLALFLAAGLCEIGGGWLVWQAVRLHKGWWMALLGAIVLFGYGLIPCAQPVDNFGRVSAAWGRGWGASKRGCCGACRAPFVHNANNKPRLAVCGVAFLFIILACLCRCVHTMHICCLLSLPTGVCCLRRLLYHPLLPLGLGGGRRAARHRRLGGKRHRGGRRMRSILLARPIAYCGGGCVRSMLRSTVRSILLAWAVANLKL